MRWLPLFAILIAGCGQGMVEEPSPYPHYTVTPSPTATLPPIDHSRLAMDIRLPTPTPTQNTVSAASQQVSEVFYDPRSCYANPDRYNWQPYALAAGFPEWVLPELAIVVQRESGGDLCAVNPSSGATCWIQQLPGGSMFFDPATCMAWGYAKWIDGGRDFYRHWYRWWP